MVRMHHIRVEKYVQLTLKTNPKIVENRAVMKVDSKYYIGSVRENDKKTLHLIP